MNTRTFHLPDLGEGLTEAVLVGWLVAVGDEIGIDQSVAEVETAKSIVELPSPYAGTITRLFGAAGETVLTGAALFEVEAAAAPHTSAAGSGPEPGVDRKVDPEVKVEVDVEHEAYRSEERAGTSGNVLIGYGTGAGPAKGRRKRKGEWNRESGGGSPRPTAAHTAATVAVRSPIVRRLARELGVDPRSVVPTGSDGSVTRHDVLVAAGATGGESSGTLPSHDRSAAERPGGSAPFTQHHPQPSTAATVHTAPLSIVRVEPFSPLRKAVSQKLSQSRREIPEATVWVDVDVTDLWTLRPRMRTGDTPAPSFTALLARFTLLALRSYPLLASRLTPTGDGLEIFDGVNLGIAADTPRGLVVPVIERADHSSLAALNASLRHLTEVARTGRLAPEQMQGSTFTLNNYGGFGVDGSAAIINYPEVAILGIGRALERPWVVDGTIVPRRIAQLSLVFDHRVCDGGYAAGFLRAVTELLENPLAAYPEL